MYKERLKYYPGFPIKGVNFVDIIPLMQDKKVFRSLIADIGKLCATPNIAAPEARGFLFAAPLLTACDNIDNIIPVRKKGKLPSAEGDLIGINITKEYGTDQLFFRLSDIAAGTPSEDAMEVTFFDDILATGGTALGVAKALQECTVTLPDGRVLPVRVKDFVFLVELNDLGGRSVLEGFAPVKSLIHI